MDHLEPHKREFKEKAADHAIDGAKTILVLAVRVVGVYLTIVAIFFAVLSQAEPGNDLVQGFRFVVMAATMGMILVITTLYLFTWRAMRFYFDVMEELAPGDMQYRMQSGRRLSNIAGALLYIFGLVGLGCILAVLIATYA